MLCYRSFDCYLRPAFLVSYLVLVFDVNVEKIAAGQSPCQLTSIRCWNFSGSWQHQLRLVNRPEIDLHFVHHYFSIKFLLSYITKLENVAIANVLQLKAARLHATPVLSALITTPMRCLKCRIIAFVLLICYAVT